MLATEKISKAFVAIVEEAEKLQKAEKADYTEGLKTIISIAKHQSDIRGATGGHCTLHKSCK